jgi:ureidoglycolate hydrolase
MRQLLESEVFVCDGDQIVDFNAKFWDPSLPCCECVSRIFSEKFHTILNAIWIK